MPKAGFFRKLGLFVEEAFLDAAACVELRSNIAASKLERGLILGDDEHAEGAVDETARVVESARLAGAIRQAMQGRLKILVPQLEAHFAVSLNTLEGPEFLTYRPGSFYKPHQDASAGASTESRRVSLVLFLNAESRQPSPDCYCGGSLTFHGLMDGPFERCAFALEGKQGLLVAFRSTTVHEVKPVSSGQRYTVAGWFRGPGTAGVSSP